MLVEEYLDIPLGIHWLDPIFFLESFFSSIFRPIRPPWNIRTSQNTFCTDLKIICQPIRSSSTIHWSPNHSPLQCTDALMMHIAHDMKQTWCECHSYPTSPSWCFTDKWKYISNIWLFQQRKKLTQFGSLCTIQKRFGHNWIKNSSKGFLLSTFCKPQFP